MRRSLPEVRRSVPCALLAMLLAACGESVEPPAVSEPPDVVVGAAPPEPPAPASPSPSPLPEAPATPPVPPPVVPSPAARAAEAARLAAMAEGPGDLEQLDRARVAVAAALDRDPGLLAFLVETTAAGGEASDATRGVLVLAGGAAIPALVARLADDPADPTALEILGAMLPTDEVEGAGAEEELALRSHRLFLLLQACAELVEAAPPDHALLTTAAWSWIPERVLPHTYREHYAWTQISFVQTSRSDLLVELVAETLFQRLDPEEHMWDLLEIGWHGGEKAGTALRKRLRERVRAIVPPEYHNAGWGMGEPPLSPPAPGTGPWCPGGTGPESEPRIFGR